MSDPDEAIRAIHTLASCEVAYDTALNLGRGLKAHTERLTAARLQVFRLIMGRDPLDHEREALLWGDA